MDTGSKAIVIAGGFLIGMLVISISMYVLTSFRSFYEQSMDQFEVQQIAAFNSFFTQYGSTIKGYDAYNIIGKINEVNADKETSYFIYFNNNISKEDTFYFTENLKKDYYYKYYFDVDGVVSRVEITDTSDAE